MLSDVPLIMVIFKALTIDSSVEFDVVCVEGVVCAVCVCGVGSLVWVWCGVVVDVVWVVDGWMLSQHTTTHNTQHTTHNTHHIPNTTHHQHTTNIPKH